MRGDGGARTGVGWAWQVMEATVGFDQKVKVMVVDGGFNSSEDYPPGTIIRQTNWGVPNPNKCSNGGECPWHGSASAMTAAAVVDNGFGTAGPAGPVAQLIVVGMFADSYKTQRRTRDMVAEYRPTVVNMSFSRAWWAFRDTTEAIFDIYLKEMSQLGALVFASSGNNGINVDAKISGDETPTVLPCESRYAVCVGGMTGGGAHNTGAAYGTLTGNRTVEIVGPYCTWRRKVDDDPFHIIVDRVCGTSEASPFVAGVAALVKSAAPGLSASEIRDLLYETANTGAPFLAPLPGGYDRRIDAYDAVVAALGIELTPPTLSINLPKAGAVLGSEQWLDVRAVAEDTFDRPLTISWRSDKEGALLTTASGVIGSAPLDPGAHTITARATDFRGVFTEKSVQIQVGLGPQVNIIAPQPGTKFFVGQSITFIAASLDPDTGDPLADNDLVWSVRKNGVEVLFDLGHKVTALGNVFSPGTYDVYLDASDGDGVASDTSSFTVLAAPDDAPPIAIIQLPVGDLDLDSKDGDPLPIDFVGSGNDAEDGTVSGFRFRWTALSQKGTLKVLCEGSAVPGGGDGGIVIPKDCSTFTGHLGADDGVTVTTWVVTLEVFDSENQPDTTHRTIKITATTP
jgi:hypothetical protein